MNWKNYSPGKKELLLLIGAVGFLFILIAISQPVTIALISSQKGTLQQNSETDEAIVKKLKSQISAIDKKLEIRVPKSYYLVINSSANEFYLYKGLELIKKDKCSTGSYILLKNNEQQQWMFKTPKGEFKIRSKTVAPVWKKPDWAFVEAGIPVPTANHYSRFEYGVLGEYSLGIGDGYLIHGTLYQRFLGLPVTHGCVRLNDENLRLVFKSLSLGSKVYIF